MQLKQLEVFVHVARLKSFSKAAEALFLTQPTVSAHISALETDLGTKLVVRAESSYDRREGDTAALVLKADKIHLFDKETEQAIAH